MGGVRRVELVLCGVVGVFLSALAAAGLQLLGGESAVDIAERHRTAVRDAVTAGRVEASGTWELKDGSRKGQWRLAAPLRLTERATWSISVLAREGDSVGYGEEGLIDEPPVRLSGEIPAERWSEETSIALAREASLGELATQTDSSDLPLKENSLPFAATVSGKMKGVRLEGEFTSPDGAPGVWSGWWHAWRSEIPGAGFSEAEASDATD